MTVRYDPLLVRALAREIEARWAGVRVRSLGLDPVRLAASVRFSDGSALVALLANDTGHVLALDSDPLEGSSVRESRFGGARLDAVHAEPDERVLVLRLADDGGRPVAGIALELHTNRWNVLALDADPDVEGAGWRIRYALRTTEIAGRRLGPGEPYAPPASTRRGLREPATATEWTATLDESGGGASRDGAPGARTAILRTWAWTSALNVEWLLAAEADGFGRYTRLIGEAAEPGTEAWLVPMRWGAQPYPLSLGVAAARRFGSLFEAGRIAADEAGGIETLLARAASSDSEPTAATDRDRLEKRLRQRSRRTAKRLRALTRQLETAGPPDEVREIGQLLLARKASLPRGTREAAIEAFDGTSRTVELDPALDAVANAERYFQEARRRERAHERLPREIAKAERHLEAVEAALERLEVEGPSDELWEVAGGKRRQPPPGRRSRGPADGDERLPYTTLRSSGGLEIRLGRGAKDNDELTFRHSAPDDIWLHASQASGAHVILRWGRREENPPGRDLREAAVVAALHSGGRHSGSVPVVWTRRKYVRKPRKSPPGTVTPDRVKTIMVRPDEDLVRRLREAARDRPGASDAGE